MRFLIIGDLHGAIPKIPKKGYDAIIAPGDFCSDDSKKYMFQMVRERMKNPKTKKKWYDLAGRKKARVLLKRSVADGRKVLKHLNSFGVPVYALPGNWDWTPAQRSGWKPLQKDYYKEMRKGLKNIVNMHNKKRDVGDCVIIGHGLSAGPEYPQYPEDKKAFTKSQLKKKREQLNRKLKRFAKLFRSTKKPVVFLTHNVPFNTKLDMIINPDSPRDGQHFGSLLARKIIDKHQPVICIGAHMHEHYGKAKVGKTTVVNAGFGPDKNTFFEIKNGKLKGLEFSKKN